MPAAPPHGLLADSSSSDIADIRAAVLLPSGHCQAFLQAKSPLSVLTVQKALRETTFPGASWEWGAGGGECPQWPAVTLTSRRPCPEVGRGEKDTQEGACGAIVPSCSSVKWPQPRSSDKSWAF